MFFAATTPPRLLTLVLFTALSVLSLNMFLPSLANMAEDFQADYALVTLSIAGYLGVTGGLSLVVGPLSDRFGRRPVMLVALVIFTLASLVCAVTTNIWVFLGFRVLQGAMVAGWALSRFTAVTRVLRVVAFVGVAASLAYFTASFAGLLPPQLRIF